MKSEHYHALNSPPDCPSAFPFTGLSKRISFPPETIFFYFQSSIRLPPSGQITRPLTTLHRPPMLLNLFRGVRQVSQYGKPYCTALLKSLWTFQLPLNLPEGRFPLGTPSKVFHLCIPEPTIWHTAQEIIPRIIILRFCQSI